MSEIQLKDWLPPGVPVAIKGILLRSYNLNDPDDLALLDQDILEIELSNGMRIDVGWFPENDHNGRFVIRVFRKNRLAPVRSPIETTNPHNVAAVIRDLVQQYGDQITGRTIAVP